MLLFLTCIMIIGIAYFISVGHMQKSQSKKSIGYALASILLTFAIIIGLSLNTGMSTEENIKSKNVKVIADEDNHMKEKKNSSP